MMVGANTNHGRVPWQEFAHMIAVAGVCSCHMGGVLAVAGVCACHLFGDGWRKLQPWQSRRCWSLLPQHAELKYTEESHLEKLNYSLI